MVGIGTSSPLRPLQVGTHGTGNGEIALGSATNGVGSILFGDGASGADVYRGYVQYNHTADALLLATAAAERVRIDASGNLLVGKTSGTAGNLIETSGRVSAGAGSTGQPTFNCEGDTNTGINLPESDRIQIITAGVERARITSGGDFVVANTAAVGTWYNGGSIGFGYSSGGYGAMVRAGTNTPFYVSTTGQGSGGFIEFSQGTATRGNITYTGSAVAYNTSSDYRLKENAAPISNALSKIDSLNPVNFSWIESGDNSDGFLAHEIQEILPYTVTGTKDELYTVENTPEEKAGQIGQPKYQVMDYAKLTPLLVKAIQEQQTLIETLTARITALES